MTCTCGDTMTMEGETREEAVGKFKAMMTQEMIDAHMAEKHPGQSMSAAETQASLDQQVVEVMA